MGEQHVCTMGTGKSSDGSAAIEVFSKTGLHDQSSLRLLDPQAGIEAGPWGMFAMLGRRRKRLWPSRCRDDTEEGSGALALLPHAVLTCLVGICGRTVLPSRDTVREPIAGARRERGENDSAGVVRISSPH